MAEPHPPSPPTNFIADDSFPDDISRCILARVPCKEDRASMSRVCKAWRAMIRRLGGQVPPSPPLPWLLLPAPNSDESARLACLLSGGRFHDNCRFPAIIPPAARFVGSYDAGWLLLAHREPHRHELLNIRTGDVLGLPGKLLILDDPNHPYPVKMVVQAAAMSSSPDDPNCVGVCIVKAAISPHYRFVAMWQMGWTFAVEIQPPEGFFVAKDVIYHDGMFCLLHSEGDQQMSMCAANSDWEHRRFHPGGRFYEDFVRARYLVSCRGDLLMVVRFSRQPDEPTSKFKVYRATERPHQIPEPDADFPVAEFPWIWTELDTLEGLIIFVGYGSSRSYEADQYPGVMAGIYYYDDDEQSNDDGAFYRDHNIMPYRCRDNGVWSEGRVQDCFQRTGPSDNSPPAWILPRATHG